MYMYMYRHMYMFVYVQYMIYMMYMYLSQSVCKTWLSGGPLSLQHYRDSDITSSSWDYDDKERSISQPLYVDQAHQTSHEIVESWHMAQQEESQEYLPSFQ